MASVQSVDMNKAMASESYAAQLIRSKNITASQRGQIVAHWGADKVKFWESVDSTEYRIEDSKLEDARSRGKKATAESVGYDGHKSYGAVKEVVGAGAAAANVAITHLGGNIAAKAVGKVVGTKL